MTPTVHTSDPTDAVERTFFRVLRERMHDVPILNPALNVEAVDFQRWQRHWLGVLVTPWCMSLLLVPGSADDWVLAGDNQRRFLKFPAGDFAFLDSHEDDLGSFQSCSLFSPMGAFANQAQAVQTARASLLALMAPQAQASAPHTVAQPSPAAVLRPATPGVATTATRVPPDGTLSRRGFFTLRRS